MMDSSEISIKGNGGNVRGDSFSSPYSEPNDPRNAMEGQKSHSTCPVSARGKNSCRLSYVMVKLDGYKAFVHRFPCFPLFFLSCGGACVSDAETALYTELWHACAGPLVTVPRERERVFYFPQGHIEQVWFIFHIWFTILIFQSFPFSAKNWADFPWISPIWIFFVGQFFYRWIFWILFLLSCILCVNFGKLSGCLCDWSRICDLRSFFSPPSLFLSPSPPPLPTTTHAKVDAVYGLIVLLLMG